MQDACILFANVRHFNCGVVESVILAKLNVNVWELKLAWIVQSVIAVISFIFIVIVASTDRVSQIQMLFKTCVCLLGGIDISVY